jgi:hypothetical protein
MIALALIDLVMVGGDERSAFFFTSRSILQAIIQVTIFCLDWTPPSFANSVVSL